MTEENFVSLLALKEKLEKAIEVTDQTRLEFFGLRVTVDALAHEFMEKLAEIPKAIKDIGFTQSELRATRIEVNALKNLLEEESAEHKKFKESEKLLESSVESISLHEEEIENKIKLEKRVATINLIAILFLVVVLALHLFRVIV